MRITLPHKQTGFTIVELLIVIVVIGILAAITIVAFNGVQQRARDSQRISDLANLAKMIRLYEAEHGDFVQEGCGNGTGSGWLHSSYTGPPLRSINTCLIDAGIMKKPLVDPSGLSSCSNGAECHAYLKASCGLGTWIFANLESRPQDATYTDDKCYPAWDTAYGINYSVKVN